MPAPTDHHPPPLNPKPPAAPQMPTVGRIVHFVMAGASGSKPPHRAAMITLVGDHGIEDSVELTVFLSHGDSREVLMRRQRDVPFDATGTIPYTWHWPERDLGLNRLDAERVPKGGTD